MKYQHSFTVNAPLDQVSAFHRAASSLKAITPPFFFMSGLQAPAQLSDGDEMAFTLWMGPLPIRWEARIEKINPAGFDDIQTSGPFKTWIHTHQFEVIDPKHTRVIDDIEYSLRRHWFWGIIGGVMALGLPILFWYRARKTRTIIEEEDRSTSDRTSL
jgi:ligand-binding SRPBCC domain-containing protein